MTISSQVNRKEYTGNGVNDTFAYTFWITASSDLIVYVDGITQTLTTHYTVTEVGEPTGGNVVFEAGYIPAAGTAVVIVRNFPITQEVDYVGGEKFPAETHEKALDRLTVICQQLADRSTVSLRFEDSVVDGSGSAISGEPADRANKYIWFDSNGDLQLVSSGTWKGDWAASTSYVLGDIIRDGSAGGNSSDLFICIAPHISAVWASESANWATMIDVSAITTFVNKDGTVELTADWDVGAFDITCIDLNATNIVAGTIKKSGGGCPTTEDHGDPTSPEVVSVVYGTGSPPAASSTPIGTLWVKYTA